MPDTVIHNPADLLAGVTKCGAAALCMLRTLCARLKGSCLRVETPGKLCKDLHPCDQRPLRPGAVIVIKYATQACDGLAIALKCLL